MKALVIGGTGPTGPYVVQGLRKRGYEVAILHRGTHEIGVEVLQEVEHLHGDPFNVESFKDTLNSRTFDVVVSMYGRLRFIAEIMKGRTQRLIAVTGAPVYLGWMNPEQNPDGLSIPVAEDAPLITDPNLDKHYGLVALGENAVMDADHEGHYSATLFRYPGIYGQRQIAPLEWSIVKRILDGRKQIILPEAGLTLATRAYTENAAHAIMLAVEQSKSRGRIYNVGDERVITLREWVNIIAESMGEELELINVPWDSAKSVAIPYTYGIHHRVLDLTKIKSELGYRDLFPVREGIRRTVNWLLKNPPQPEDVTKKQIKDPFAYAVEDKLIKQYRYL